MSKFYKHELRKFSLYKEDGTWIHFPQRSELLVQFFQLNHKDDVTITVLWRGTVLDKFTIQRQEYVFSVIAKYPSIGYKQTDAFGKVIKRFQYSFHDIEMYHKCLHCLQVELKIPIVDMETKSRLSTQLHNQSQTQQLSQSQYESHSQYEPSQPRNVTVQTPSQHERKSQYGPCQNAEPRFHIPDLSACIPPSSHFQHSAHSKHHWKYSPPRILSQLNLPYSPMPSPSGYADPMTLPSPKVSTDQMQSTAEFTIEELLNLEDPKLKDLVREILKDKKFVEVVKKLDKIIN